MKTSNKLIFTAVLVILAALIRHDFNLKAEYLSGDHTTPTSGYTALEYTGFDRVELDASTAANVKFVQGPFSVRIDKTAADFVVFRQQGTRLRITAGFSGAYQWTNNAYVVLISCPTLSALTTGATYLAHQRPFTDTTVRDDWNMRQVLVEGFRQDSLSIEQDYGSTVVLARNSIGSLRAVIGKSQGSGSKIVVQSGNEFRDAVLDIGQRSRLFLENATIQHLSYQLADSAQLILTGNAQHLLFQTNPSRP